MFSQKGFANFQNPNWELHEKLIFQLKADLNEKEIYGVLLALMNAAYRELNWNYFYESFYGFYDEKYIS